MTSLLCKLGLHKWRNHGERVLISWEEPGFIIGTKKKVQKYVFSERECLRCGIREKRLFSKNIDGTLAAAGWKRIKNKANH